MRFTSLASLFGLLGLAALPACAADRPLAAPADDATTRAHLERGQVFLLDTDAAQIGVGVTFDRGDRLDKSFVAIAVIDGSVLVRADEAGAVTLDDLALELGELALPADIYPGDVRLVDLRARLVAPLGCAETTWVEDDEAAYCYATSAAFTVRGGMVIDGETYPFAPQTLVGLELDLMVLPTERGARLDLAGKSRGVAWSWAGVIELEHIAFDLTANASYP